jgi:transposase, IS5 family
MYQSKTHQGEERIVSILQPHVRPIVRGKASADVEVGAKITVSRVNYCFRIETLSWNNFNESTELTTAIERYLYRYECYPQVVLADELYRNHDGLIFYKKHEIRLSGPRLGRLRPSAWEDRKIARMDSIARNAIESPFGMCKRRYGWTRSWQSFAARQNL